MSFTRRTLLAGVALLASFSALPAAAQTGNKTLAITQIVAHPALDSARKGVLDALAAKGYVEGKNLKVDFQNAQGQPATAQQIARKFIGDRPDVIVPITTPSSQPVVAATTDIPVVFTAVTDPVAAKLVKSLDAPGGNVTGVSDLLPMKPQLELIKKLVPTAKNIGFIYNPGEANSVALLEATRREAALLGLSIVEGVAPNSGAVQGGARSLIGKVDVIYIPNDSTVVTAVEAIVKVGTDAKVPVIAGDTASVERGAIAALGFDYYDLGVQTGDVVAQVFGGKKPGDIPVLTVSKLDLYLNKKTAAAQGVTLPADMLASAKKVVE